MTIVAVAGLPGVGKTTWIHQQLSQTRGFYCCLANDIVPIDQTYIGQIQQGVVRSLTWSEAGTVVIIGYWGVGDAVGQPLASVQPYHIECLTSVVASCIPVNQWIQVSEAIFCHARQVEELLCIVRQERVHHRLLQLFVWLAHKFGRAVELGQLIDLHLTHQSLAETIGTTRVTVTRLLAKFEQQGIVRRQNRHFILLRSVW